jgi:hypothetical protein
MQITKTDGVTHTTSRKDRVRDSILNGTDK